MTRPIELPDNPSARFREIYDALNAERGFLQDASPLRFAAMSQAWSHPESTASSVYCRATRNSCLRLAVES